MRHVACVYGLDYRQLRLAVIRDRVHVDGICASWVDAGMARRGGDAKLGQLSTTGVVGER